MNRAKNEMTRRVSFVVEGDELVTARSTMRALGVHHVPVLRGGAVVGILSDRDVLRRSAKKLVADVMSREVITCPPEATIGEVAGRMVDNAIHCLPVVDAKGALVGIITSTDLLRLLRESEWRPLDRIPFQFEKPLPLMEVSN